MTDGTLTQRPGLRKRLQHRDGSHSRSPSSGSHRGGPGSARDRRHERDSAHEINSDPTGSRGAHRPGGGRSRPRRLRRRQRHGGGEVSGTAPGAGQPECAQLEQFGDLSGKEVSVYTSIIAPEDAAQKASYKVFEDCTGATVNYEGSSEFEAQLVVRVQGGNAPDVAYVPQPGLLQTLVRDTGKVVEPPQAVSDNVDKWFGEDWKTYGTVDDTFYAAPLGANVKSFVWYSPKMFEENGWEVPETWDDMIALSDEIAPERHQAVVRGHRVR